MLSKIQEDEQLYGSDSRICYLLTDRDIQYIFETIWNSQSILSATNDIYQLEFVRWNKEEEWTPWNTILLTIDEAESHLKLTSLELVKEIEIFIDAFKLLLNFIYPFKQSYGEPFIKKIKQKHAMARNYFSKLPNISEYLRKMELRGDIHLPSLTGIKIN